MRRALGLLALWAALSGLGGCSSVPFRIPMLEDIGPSTEKADPWERFNRSMFGFNDMVDTALIKPAAQGYRAVLPEFVRTGISNVFGNLTDAWSAVNLALQLKPQAALEMGMRVATNSVFGLGGLLDVADEVGLEKRTVEDFGQTLGRWGLDPGPYLVLPLFGPSTLRDAAALVLDFKASPSSLLFGKPAERNGALAVYTLSKRVSLLNASRVLDEIALDKYVLMRDAYLARRRSLIYDGEPPDDVAPPGK